MHTHSDANQIFKHFSVSERWSLLALHIFTAITLFLHYEYSAHLHAGLHKCYVRRRFCVYNSFPHTQLLFLLLLPLLFFFFLLWFFLVWNTDDSFVHTILITSPVLIWTFLMFNHFNKNVISTAKWKKEKKKKFLLLEAYFFPSLFFVLF